MYSASRKPELGPHRAPQVSAGSSCPVRREQRGSSRLKCLVATRFTGAGEELVQAQRILGRSDTNLTARIYTHVGVGELCDAMNRLLSTADQARKVGA